MSIACVVVSLIALVSGALAAAADGALLAAASTHGNGPEEPTGGVRNVTHRSLSIARLFTHLVAGAAGAAALGLPQLGTREAVPAAIVLAVVIVALGEVLPRAVGDALGPQSPQLLHAVARTTDRILRPIVGLGMRIDRALRHVLPPARASEADREATAEQFKQVVRSDEDTLVNQRAILHRIFSLGDTEVHEIMVPRVDILGIERSTPWSEVVDRVRSSQHARLPVYDKTLDRITGLLFAKDLLAGVISDDEPAPCWQELIRPASFIPESKSIDSQLRDFKASGSHLAIVVDEYGGTAGLLTIEDILEEIVGDIRDEYDSEEPEVESEEGKRFWVAGRVALDELSELLGSPMERDDVSTVGGLIFELVGHVPRAGQELQLDGYRVVVERVMRRRIERVYFERLEVPAVSEQ
ncbi:MAG TPA: hemolysin family protein [Gemmatimonadaceae bacterium]|nr:hemolysin family protein [Gemmatimonadaceae bacterium]